MSSATQRYFSTGTTRGVYEKDDPWGLNITISAALAVISEGAKRVSLEEQAGTSGGAELILS
jgi:hypothetical protein